MKEAFVSYKSHFLFTITYNKDREQVITVGAKEFFLLFLIISQSLTKITFLIFLLLLSFSYSVSLLFFWVEEENTIIELMETEAKWFWRAHVIGTILSRIKQFSLHFT